MSNKYVREHLKARLIGAFAKIEALKDVDHPVIKGRLREIVINDFLASITPNTYGLTSGKIIDSFGKESPQMDVIVYFKDAYPIIAIDECTSLVPIETVAYVIEAKTSLKLKDLRSTWSNFKELNQLQCRDVNGNGYEAGISRWIFSPKKSFQGRFHQACNQKLDFNGSFLPYISGIISNKEYCYYGNISRTLQWCLGLPRESLEEYLLDFATGYINTLIEKRFHFGKFGYYTSDY
ncbi:MAG: hypothetical protein O2970_12080 [Proteobacteria bacterium]|nr:hypothetical protein [Pseudomonadota bacterium]MDG4544519.1 hypothetical protein [Rickettsiales bacterium]